MGDSIRTRPDMLALPGRGSALGLCLVVLLAGCAALSPSHVSVQGALAQAASQVARVAVDPAHAVLVRAVDEALLPGVQVSNHLRPLTYVLPAGRHELWLSELPYGMPLLPQHIDCYILQVDLAAGAGYVLRLDSRRRLPVLVRAGAGEPEAVGEVVDRPFLLERACRWR